MKTLGANSIDEVPNLLRQYKGFTPDILAQCYKFNRKGSVHGRHRLSWKKRKCAEAQKTLVIVSVCK